MLDAQDGEQGVRELARALQLSPSTVHRALTILEQEGLVQQETVSGRYRIGLEFYRLAWQAQVRYPIREIAMPYLSEIVAQCNETVFLGLYEPQRMEMLFAASVDSAHPLRYVVPLHQWFPVYASASGLAVMAFLNDDQRRQIVEKTRLAPITDRTITDPVVLEREIQQIRAQGYACTHGRRIPGAVSIAVPLCRSQEQVIGDLVLTIPEQRFDPTEELRLAQLLMSYSRSIAEQFGTLNAHEAAVSEPTSPIIED